MDATNERRCTIALRSIAKSLERIATAMEKGNAPGGEVQGQVDEATQELKNRLDAYFKRQMEEDK